MQVNILKIESFFHLIFVLSKHIPFRFFFWVVDPPGAQEKVLEIATSLGLSVRVAVTHEVSVKELGMTAQILLWCRGGIN